MQILDPSINKVYHKYGSLSNRIFALEKDSCGFRKKMVSMTNKTLFISLLALNMTGVGQAQPSGLTALSCLTTNRLTALSCLTTNGALRPGQKKLLYYGWGTRDTRYVREHWQEMETLPFDGIGISVGIDRAKPTSGDGATANLLGWNLFGPQAFRLEDFRPAIDDLQAAPWQKFTDNFLTACICSSGQDQGFHWFDDARWEGIVNNWRILVTIAKEGGCKGIILDPEHYGADFFHYPSMKGREDKPFAEYAEKVRQRGRELMAATREVFPDIAILMFWAHSNVALYPGQMAAAPEQRYYGLLSAFVDGLLEASDPQARFVDLCEFAYGYKERVQFLEAYHAIHNRALPLTALPQRYKAQMEAGFGLWLDNGGAERWSATDFSKNYFRPVEFEQALQTALEVSDGYVWIYSHVPGFFPPSNLPEAYREAIARARAAVEGR
jgi:hypothetical protein